MPPREKIPGQPIEWLKRAKSNLAMAKIKKPEESLWEELCFNAQQAAEKALKAVLLFHSVKFPYVHDLEVLITIMEQNGISVPEIIKRATDLTEYAIETRYPGIEPVSEEEYRQAVLLAEGVLSWAESIILSRT